MDFGEIEPSAWRGGELRAPAPASEVTFSRRELDRILGLYGRMVAAGEWRDYAIDFLKDRAVFSVFRRAAEVPIYRIEKNPQLGAAPGRLQRDLGDRSHPAPRPRTRPRAQRARSLAPGGCGVSALRRRRVAAAERALHQHGVEPAAVLEADRLATADHAGSRPRHGPRSRRCCAESPITAIIWRKPRGFATRRPSRVSSSRPIPRR